MSESPTTDTAAAYYHFVIIPKILDPWYDDAWFGCQAKAKELSVTHNASVECSYIGYPEAIPEEQARIITELVTNPAKYNLTKAPDGISVAALDEDITGAAIDFVFEAGVPIITFDSDSSQSKRQAFVSTDNYAFGVELAKVLDQLNPNGGYFGMITGNGPNLVDRLRGVRDRLLNDPLNPTRWKEVDYSPLNCDNNVTLANELMHVYAKDPKIEAVIPVGGWPMFNPVLWKEFVDENRGISTVVADSVDVQLELMGQGYVLGLVGQLPYQMGEFSARELFSITTSDSTVGREPQDVLGTHMLEILRVPLQLPPLTVNLNHIGNVVILGYILFCIVTVASIGLAVWVYKYRKSHVIRVSQPPFLYMICGGVLILGSALIPLTIDDERFGQRSADIACMSVPWLISIGFCTTFVALFSKTWRIFRLMRGASKFQRLKISAKGVLAPYVVLMMVNLITLISWTVIAPLTYERSPNLGTDDWNRVISTYGSCRGTGSMPFFGILVAVNISGLVALNFYAYLSRHIHTEYSESRYIALVNASMLQAAVIGLPIVYLVYSQPMVYYIVMSLLIFVTCMAVLGFILYPKYTALHQWKDDMTKRGSSGTTKRRGSLMQSVDFEPAGMRFAVVDASKEFDKLQKSVREAESVVRASVVRNNDGSVDILKALIGTIEDLSKDESNRMQKILIMFSALGRDERDNVLKKLSKHASDAEEEKADSTSRCVEASSVE